MAQHDGLTIGTFDDCGHDITQFEFHVGIGMIFPTLFNNILVESSALCRRGGKMDHPVSAINIQHCAYRSKTMSRI